MDDDWQARADALWERFDEHEPEAFVEAMRHLVTDLPEGSAVGAFELAGAYDSTGGTDRAVPLYREALERTAAAALTLTALAAHLPRYRRSLTAYAAEL